MKTKLSEALTRPLPAAYKGQPRSQQEARKRKEHYWYTLGKDNVVRDHGPERKEGIAVAKFSPKFPGETRHQMYLRLLYRIPDDAAVVSNWPGPSVGVKDAPSLRPPLTPEPAIEPPLSAEEVRAGRRMPPQAAQNAPESNGRLPSIIGARRPAERGRSDSRGRSGQTSSFDGFGAVKGSRAAKINAALSGKARTAGQIEDIAEVENAQRHLDRLVGLGLVVKTGNKYRLK